MYHIEFVGSNLGLERDPIKKISEMENILNKQELNGYLYQSTFTLSQASGIDYVYMVFRNDKVTPPAAERVRTQKF